jgi:DNA repair protein RadA/Sms
LVSSLTGVPLPRDTVFFGEISLSGDIRPVPQAEARLKEAAKLGFSRAFVPAGTRATSVNLTEIANVAELACLVPARHPSANQASRPQRERAKLES